MASPSLRCLQVKSNGDVILTWIPPADPNSQFDSYDIFSSLTAGGPFTNVGSLGALVLNTFTHTGAAANVQSRYYYVITKYGVGGASSSSPSDTLRSIFLNALQSTPDVKLSYNGLHLPKLNSSASTFSLSKEYPAGVWGNLGVTSNLNYADTISLCSYSLNYQVALSDASGCISLSNIQGGVFSDAKAPDEPIVDSISVLPNGQTVIAWKLPRDQDVVKYRIYYQNAGINIAVDSVTGKNNTIYTYTPTTANNQPVSIFVSAIDSCFKIGSFDTKPTTIHLQTVYNTCAYSTNLSWTPYKGFKNGVSEYRVYYSVNGAAFQMIGSTALTDFVHTNVAPGANITYFVRAFNSGKTITSSSNRKQFFSTQAQSPTFIYFRNTSVIDDKNIELKIHIDLSKTFRGIELTRSIDGLNFSSVAYLPYNGSPDYSYTDTDLDTKQVSYFYRAVVRDSCDNPRIISNVSKSVLLKANNSKENEFLKLLRWTDYKGYAGGVSGYNVFRMVNGAQPGSLVGSTGPNDTVFVDNVEDEAPNGSLIEYRVEAVEGITNPYGFQETSKSNHTKVYQEAQVFVPTAFAPNGSNKTWLPVTHFVDKTDYRVIVFDRWGRELFNTSDDKQAWDGANAKPGIYIYLITYKNSRGEYIEIKGSVTLL